MAEIANFVEFWGDRRYESCNIYGGEILEIERTVVDRGHSRYDINSRYINISRDIWVCLRKL